MNRAELRQEVRDNIQEAAAIDGAIFGDDLLNRHIDREIRSLPSKDIYLEELWETTLDPTIDYTTGVALPDDTFKVEGLQRNDGTSTSPYWTDLSGVDNYQNALYLSYTPTVSQPIRAKIKKYFSIVDDDTTEYDVPEDKMEVVVWGVTLRCYRILVGYLRGSQSWDSVTKPGDLNINTINSWLREAQDHYKELLQRYQTEARPRDIDLVS